MKWLFLVHQVQTPNSRERVKVWRLTKKVGAVLYRNSVYVLPFSKDNLEHFQWLCQQINDSRGEASFFTTEPGERKEDQRLKSLFNKARVLDYRRIQQDLERLQGRVRRLKDGRHPSLAEQKSIAKELKNAEIAFAEVQKVDFFEIPLSGRIETLIGRVRRDLTLSGTGGTTIVDFRHYDRKDFKRKKWSTRKNIHIDRLCSAWLIKRFVDPKARFLFVPESKIPQNTIPFDVLGAEFSHRGDDCTFETLLKTFRLKDAALEVIGEIVHDIDMHDGKFGRQEAAGLDLIVRSLSESMENDHKVLEVGSTILDTVYARLAAKKARK